MPFIYIYSYLHFLSLREKYSNTEFFLVCIFPYLDWIRRIYIVYLPLTFSVLIATKTSAFPIFFSIIKKWKYYAKNIFSLAFTVFKFVILSNFIFQKNQEHLFFIEHIRWLHLIYFNFDS